MRGWLEASALADGVDLAASVLAKGRERSVVSWLIPTSAAAAAAANIALSRQLDPAPAAEPGQPEAIVTGHSEPA